MKISFVRAPFSSLPLFLLLASCAHAQSRNPSEEVQIVAPQPHREDFSSSLLGPAAAPRASEAGASADLRLLSPTSAALPRDNHPVEPYPTNVYWPPWSRIGIGADISPLGIGIKSAIILNTYMDARLMDNFFNYTPGRIEVDGFNVYAKIHMDSAAVALDTYPWHSVWRLSIGTLFYNTNQLSARLATAPGTSFTLDGQTFYSAGAGAGRGATPLTGTANLGLDRIRPALTLSGGFGKFVPRSDRHWSFPTEFGVAFTGSPTLQVNTTGWVCLDALQTQCSNIGNPANPIAVEYNSALQSRLSKTRNSLDAVHIYPIFSYSVVYSFNAPW